MTAPEPTPTADEHADAVARAMQPGAWKFSAAMSKERARIDARRLLTTTDADAIAALAASLPAEVMLAALVDRGTLTAEDAPIARHGGHEHTHWQQRWDGQHTHEGRRFVTPWEVAE